MHTARRQTLFVIDDDHDILGILARDPIKTKFFLLFDCWWYATFCMSRVVFCIAYKLLQISALI